MSREKYDILREEILFPKNGCDRDIDKSSCRAFEGRLSLKFSEIEARPTNNDNIIEVFPQKFYASALHVVVWMAANE